MKKSTKNFDLPKDKIINMLNCDNDIILLTPNGKKIQIQFRPDNNSIDICFDPSEEIICHNWQGENMQSSPPLKNEKGIEQRGVHKISQVCFIGNFINNSSQK